MRNFGGKRIIETLIYALRPEKVLLIKKIMFILAKYRKLLTKNSCIIIMINFKASIIE